VSAYISNHAWITGDLPRALASGRRALALAEALADRGLAVEANLRLGQVHSRLGQYRDAVTFFEAAEPVAAAAPADPPRRPTELGLYWIAPPPPHPHGSPGPVARERRACYDERAMVKWPESVTRWRGSR
jgi:tetratricopeptide (TPR) repeat protein